VLLEPVDDIGAGYVMQLSRGDDAPAHPRRSRLCRGARRPLAQCGTVLAQIHALDTGPCVFLAGRPDSLDPIDAERRRLDVYGEAHPAIELGLRWLERHRPRTPARPMLVHGDFRTGNLMVGADGLRAVLDWECTRLGDGMLDIGWLCMRSRRFGRVDLPVGGFGDRAALYTAYQVAGGAVPDPELVHYWEIGGLVRWACLNVMQGHGHVLGGRRSVVYAAAGRNSALIEYELLMTLAGRYH
jgi:aminoglycoside phosphotransferase (APT) family kinase protein